MVQIMTNKLSPAPLDSKSYLKTGIQVKSLTRPFFEKASMAYIRKKKKISTSVIRKLLSALSTIVLDCYDLWAWTVSGFSTNNNHGGFFLIFWKEIVKKFPSNHNGDCERVTIVVFDSDNISVSNHSSPAQCSSSKYR